MIIRPATEADFPAIKALIHHVGINPMGLAWERFLVIVDEYGSLVGCGQVKPHGDGTRELASIAVVEFWRGQGLASQIINRLLDENPGRLYLTCRAHMGAFYERFGFREVTEAELTSYYRRLQRLAGILRRVGMTDDRLLVMVRG
jgi:N-acetylglutamate synthase-like GNAT family acetyltransferase